MECHREEKSVRAGDLAAWAVRAGCWAWAAVSAGGVHELPTVWTGNTSAVLHRYCIVVVDKHRTD